MLTDLVFAALIGSVLSLVIGAGALVVLAAWFLHSTASQGAAVRAFKRPIDDAIAAGDDQVPVPSSLRAGSGSANVRQDAPGRVAEGGAATHPLPGPPEDRVAELRRAGCL